MQSDFPRETNRVAGYADAGEFEKSQDAEDLPLTIRMSSTRVASQCAKESEKGASLHALNLHMMAPTSATLAVVHYQRKRNGFAFPQKRGLGLKCGE